jgi:hypothetical protein
VITPGQERKVQRAPSVNEMILEELAKAVTDELVGPEFTPITKPSPKGSPGKSSDEEKKPLHGTPLINGISSVSGKSTSHTSEKIDHQQTAKSEEDMRLKMVVNHLYSPVLEKVKEHLKGLPDWYTAKTPPQEVARHIRTLLEARRFGVNKVAVSVWPQHDATLRLVPGLFVVVVCAKDRRQLLDAITRCVSTRASISEATIVTTGDGFALDRFVLSLRPDESDRSLFDDLNRFGNNLKHDIEDVLATTPVSPALTPYQSSNGKNGKSQQQLGKAPLHKRSGSSSSIGATPPHQPQQSSLPPSPEKLSFTAKFEVPFQEIRLVRVLGEGRTGKTYLAEWNGARVAAKVMTLEEGAQTPRNKKFKSNLDEFQRELHMVSKLSHPNIVRFMGASARPPRYILLFELCEGGDLGALIRQKDRKYSFFQLALDIANGLAFLHRNDVIHRDVKPENLMMDKAGRVKVADFGLSCYASGAAAEFTAETGTYRYMAPEVMRHEHYSFPADVYSFALVCYVLLSRRLPFDDCTPLQAAMAVARQDARPKLPAGIPKPLADLLNQCWSRDPNRRPDFETIVEALSEYRVLLNNRSRKSLDWGFHDVKKKSSSTFSSMTSLATAAI